MDVVVLIALGLIVLGVLVAGHYAQVCASQLTRIREVLEERES